MPVVETSGQLPVRFNFRAQPLPSSNVNFNFYFPNLQTSNQINVNLQGVASGAGFSSSQFNLNIIGPDVVANTTRLFSPGPFVAPGNLRYLVNLSGVATSLSGNLDFYVQNSGANSNVTLFTPNSGITLSFSPLYNTNSLNTFIQKPSPGTMNLFSFSDPSGYSNLWAFGISLIDVSGVMYSMLYRS